MDERHAIKAVLGSSITPIDPRDWRCPNPSRGLPLPVVGAGVDVQHLACDMASFG